MILLKIIAMDNGNWQQKPVAEALIMSQSEISQSVARMQYAGLLFENGKKVMRSAFLEFLQHGISYVFPQKPGAMVRGIPTAHSALPLNKIILSQENYVWPSAKGKIRGQSIIPLFPTVPDAAVKDSQLHELLSLVDALRIGKVRERNLALTELTKRIS
ncbi:MAG: hypothetical protein M3Q95_11845 [Bacteroidota bacterium]|nr:hypothetical protein [Bacteroidota bacterium]